MKRLYFKKVEIVQFSGGGKVSQMSNTTLRFSDVTVPITKKFEKFDFAIADDTHVYLYNRVFRKKLNKEVISLAGFYKQNCTIEENALATYMINGKLLS